MSIGAPAYSALPGFQGIAPDSDQEVICLGASRLTIQISNQPVYITFGLGPGGAVRYDINPEYYLPTTGSIGRPFDAFKIRAAIPSSQLGLGQIQAYAVLTPRP